MGHSRLVIYDYRKDSPFRWSQVLVRFGYPLGMTSREIAADRQDWRAKANCRSATLSEILSKDKTFFLGRGGKATKARQFCDGCPVKRNCLAFAFYYHEEEGIWGGLTPDERRDMPEFLKDLILLEAAELIDPSETRDPSQWLPIIFPSEQVTLDDAI